MPKHYIFFLLSVSFCFGQQYDLRFKTINHRDGISANRITAVLQDSDGIIWLGNRIAIDRYDGQKSVALSLGRNNLINQIAEDEYKNIWAATYQGLYILTQGEQEFKKVEVPNQKYQYILTQDFSQILFTGENEAYYTTTAGILGKFQFDHQGNLIPETFQYHENLLNLDNFIVTKMIQGADHSMYLGTSNGSVYKFEKNSISKILINDSTNQTRINDIELDRDGKLWVATNGNGIFKVDIQSGKTTHYTGENASGQSINNNVVLCLLYKDEKIWMGTDGGGLNIYDKKTETFHYYTQNYYKSDNIADNSILAIEKGHNNNILLATVHGGLSVVKSNFVIENISSLKLGITRKDQQGSTILEDSFGHIWVSAGRQGLIKYHPKRKTSEFYVDDPKINSDLNGRIVMDLLEDKNNRLWIATLRGGISVLDIKSNTFLPMETSNKLKYSYVLEQDESGNIWVGHRTGITIFDSDLNVKQNILMDNELYSSSNLVNVILRDVKNDMWVGTANGLFVFQKNDSTYSKKQFKHNSGDSTTLSENHIRSIAQAKDLSILVGTFGYGLNRFNRTTETFEHIGPQGGIKGNIIEGILIDHLDNIWLSTNIGLSKIDTLGHISNFNQNDGIHSFNGGSAYLAKSGDIYMAGTYGLSNFSPSALKTATNEFKINFTAVHAKNQDSETTLNSTELVNYTKNAKNSIILQPRNTLLTVTYTSSDPILSDGLNYAYTMEKLNDEWNEVGSLQTISFSNLNPGEYTLKVKAVDQAGNSSKHVALLNIKVLPTLWESMWFRIVVVFGFLLIISLLYRWRISFLKERETKLQQLLEHKTLEVKAQQHKIVENKIKLLQIEKDNHDLQEKQLRDELNFKNEELTNNTLRSVHKNDLLNTIKEKLKNELKQSEVSKKNIATLVEHINDSFMFDKEWDNFYSLFNQIHPSFIKDLRELHPNLNERDVKLSALIFMKFTSKHMATLFGISVSSVKIARHRLKKKLQLQSNVRVIDHLEKIAEGSH